MVVDSEDHDSHFSAKKTFAYFQWAASLGRGRFQFVAKASEYCQQNQLGKIPTPSSQRCSWTPYRTAYLVGLSPTQASFTCCLATAHMSPYLLYTICIWRNIEMLDIASSRPPSAGRPVVVMLGTIMMLTPSPLVPQDDPVGPPVPPASRTAYLRRPRYRGPLQAPFSSPSWIPPTQMYRGLPFDAPDE